MAKEMCYESLGSASKDCSHRGNPKQDVKKEESWNMETAKERGGRSLLSAYDVDDVSPAHWAGRMIPIQMCFTSNYLIRNELCSLLSIPHLLYTGTVLLK